MWLHAVPGIKIYCDDIALKSDIDIDAKTNDKSNGTKKRAQRQTHVCIGSWFIKFYDV